MSRLIGVLSDKLEQFARVDISSREEVMRDKLFELVVAEDDEFLEDKEEDVFDDDRLLLIVIRFFFFVLYYIYILKNKQSKVFLLYLSWILNKMS